MSPLRAWMIEDMTLAGLALGTQKIWVCREFRAGEMAGLPNWVSAAI
jgi:hypothetical protein